MRLAHPGHGEERKKERKKERQKVRKKESGATLLTLNTSVVQCHSRGMVPTIGMEVVDRGLAAI
jgi:hypothetical protein